MALATLVRLLLQRSGSDTFPYGIFLLPTFFSALAVGFGPGLLAMVAGAVTAFVLSYDAERTFWPLLQTDTRLVLYLVISSVALIAGGLIRSAQIRTYERGQALRESEARLRRAHDSGGVGDWEWRPSDGWMRGSESVTRMVGRDPATYDLRGKGFRDTLHPDDLLIVDRALHKVVRGEAERFDVEVRAVWPDGSIRWLAARGEAERSEAGGLTRLVGIIFDVTALREAEERLRHANEELEIRVEERTRALTEANTHLAEEMAERERAESALRQAQKMEAVGQLTGGVAHDFNNLLTAIGGNLGLLRRRVERDERASQLVAGALRSTERGAQLTRQLLAFGRRQKLALQPTDINRVVTGMENLLQSTLGASVQVRTVLAQPLAPALADAGQMELVILNLAINARDAMSGSEIVRIETARKLLGPPQRSEEPAAGDYVMVAVTDTGIGIGADHLEKVFEPFFTTKEVGKGSGLGLPQVLGVAQQSGGGVKLLSQPGRGTTVQVFLPLAAGPALPPLPSDPAPKAVSIPAGARILLVDDDAEVRAVVADMLEVSGFTVTMASNGEAALDLIAKDQGYALLIVDYAMPGMTGAEVMRQAGRHWPGLPILIITGYAEAARLAEEFGAAKVIQKPFYAEEIAERASRAIIGDTP